MTDYPLDRAATLVAIDRARRRRALYEAVADPDHEYHQVAVDLADLIVAIDNEHQRERTRRDAQHPATGR